MRLSELAVTSDLQSLRLQQYSSQLLRERRGSALRRAAALQRRVDDIRGRVRGSRSVLLPPQRSAEGTATAPPVRGGRSDNDGADASASAVRAREVEEAAQREPEAAAAVEADDAHLRIA